MTSTERILLSPPHLSGLESEYIKDAIASNWIAPLGPHVDAFEVELAELVGLQSALAVSFGTAAIHLALSALGVGRGDVVYCSSLTFVATANPIMYVGATPLFIDSESSTWNMDPLLLERTLMDAADAGELPGAVIVVDIYGQSADYDAIVPICRRYGVPLISDAAEALGSRYKGKACGSFGEVGVLSFNGNKIITTSGGGALVSDDAEFLSRCRFLSTQARVPARHHEHHEVGFNYRMSNLLAAVGRAQLPVLGSHTAARQRIFETYSVAFDGLQGVRFQSELDGSVGNRWLSAFTIDRPENPGVRDLLLDALELGNIEARPVWKPLHKQPVFADSQATGGGVAVSIFDRGICLPSGSALSDDDLRRVISVVVDVLG